MRQLNLYLFIKKKIKENKHKMDLILPDLLKITNEILTQIPALNIADNEEHITNLLTRLRLMLTKGSEHQDAFANNKEFGQFVQHVVFNPTMRAQKPKLHNLTLQIMANGVVNNKNTQATIWEAYGAQLSELAYAVPLDSSNNVVLMIIYNVFLGLGARVVIDSLVFQTCIRVWQAILQTQSNNNFEFLHFLLEHYMVKDGRNGVACYQRLVIVEERIAFLDYVAHYLNEHSPNGKLTTFLLHFFAKEFKMKSDCILRETLKLRHELHPREVHTLLRIIASASGSDMYPGIFADDPSLFINISSLLRCVVAADKQPDQLGSLDKPMSKLEQVALSSNMSADHEAKVSYELKTLLVRCTANLLYDNPANRGYCLDTDVLPTLLECTVMDARNPLMREWCILAIRNACVNCPEAQKVIGGLTMQGTAPNSLLSELNLDMGALRITDNHS